jgi:hypothetical protein
VVPGAASRGAPEILNHLWNGVTTLQFARLCEDIVTGDSFDAFRALNHTLHYVVNEAVTKYELLCLFRDVYGRDCAIESVDAPGPRVDRTLASRYLKKPLRPMRSAIELKRRGGRPWAVGVALESGPGPPTGSGSGLSPQHEEHPGADQGHADPLGRRDRLVGTHRAMSSHGTYETASSGMAWDMSSRESTATHRRPQPHGDGPGDHPQVEIRVDGPVDPRPALERGLVEARLDQRLAGEAEEQRGREHEEGQEHSLILRGDAHVAGLPSWATTSSVGLRRIRPSRKVKGITATQRAR